MSSNMFLIKVYTHLDKIMRLQEWPCHLLRVDCGFHPISPNKCSCLMGIFCELPKCKMSLKKVARR